MDDIVRTVKGNPGVVLEAANKLHPNLQFTIEELDSNGNLAFLGLNVNVDSGKKVTCGWYQKPTDTGTILNFRGCALCSIKETLLKGRFIGFSEVPQHGKILTRHWKKIGSNGLKINIRKMQYRGNPSQLLAAKVRLISGAQIIFTTRKLKTCLTSLKTSFACELRSKVVYKLTCIGVNPPMSARQSDI